MNSCFEVLFNLSNDKMQTHIHKYTHKQTNTQTQTHIQTNTNTQTQTHKHTCNRYRGKHILTFKQKDRHSTFTLTFVYCC